MTAAVTRRPPESLEEIAVLSAPISRGFWDSRHRCTTERDTAKFYDWNLTQYLCPAMGSVKLRAIDRGVCRTVIKGLLALKG